ncbi:MULTISPECIES: indole-3-glycerol phosphate synthase TrpC [unclassified Anaerobiospirillum]|uniref:indole-3-glycerol phosphate synthase TrpC n=1 Tax=unclassified Anaerobiospirillum TaxID=2647410 RepID=UPI001FF370D2|nr:MULTISPECIES: indole-3-glycerol phosphate synthase TrpC [unclassified Anaerobiospirillum]MCK0534907.1 indole-3-glycerol phosphate synthase TrpC [Anaerobiospirillum sp. NML120511]MCK0540089.1 indole-3-glycerol phosphate synthase TrpC [Anaerobiospirillum sp. NML02-A-032]
MTILDKLADHARERVAAASAVLPLEACRERALAAPAAGFAFENSLKERNSKGELAIICECKKASPSRGLIAPDFPYLEIARDYEAAGADGISVLTEPQWFLGSDSYLEQIAAQVKTPCLRKDFTVDDYQIYEARLLGASCILLICSLLKEKEIVRMLSVCEDLGLSALVEAHDADEVALAVRAGARMIGVNNRNLKDFTVNTDNSRRLRDLVPEDRIFVAESGVHSAADVTPLKQTGVNAILVGESLMRADNKAAKIAEFRNA